MAKSKPKNADATKVEEKKNEAKEILQELLPCKAAVEIAEKHIKKFERMNTLRRALEGFVCETYELDEPAAGALVKKITDFTQSKLKSDDKDWTTRLDLIFDGVYPKRPREFYALGGFAHKRTKPSTLSDAEKTAITFISPSLDPVRSIGSKCLLELAPALVDIEFTGEDVNKPKLVRTAELERFKEHESVALPKGAVHEVIFANRPMRDIKDHIWFDETGLLKEIMSSKPVVKNPDVTLYLDFVKDLRSKFSFQSEGIFANYLCYLLQPFLSRMAAGGFPVYAFSGIQGAGKTTLARDIPGALFLSDKGCGASAMRLAPNDREFSIQMHTARDLVYLVFDEIANATPDQMKNLDFLATAKRVQFRNVYGRPGEFDNYLVIAVTAVSRSFTPETERRLLPITLTEKDEGSIGEFMRTWSTRWPDVFSSLFDRVQTLPFMDSDLIPVVNRGQGFSLLRYFVQEIFGVAPDMTLAQKVRGIYDVLPDVVASFEAANRKGILGIPRGDWIALSPTRVLNNMTDAAQKKGQVLHELDIALGGKCTDANPVLSTGIKGPSGKFYHIKKINSGGKTEIAFKLIQVNSGASASPTPSPVSPETPVQ